MPSCFSHLVEAVKVRVELDFSAENQQYFKNVCSIFEDFKPESLTFLPIDSFEKRSVELFASTADNIRIPGERCVVDEKQFRKNFDGNRKFCILDKSIE